jgi:His-Xaa-Ser system protein HxsD
MTMHNVQIRVDTRQYRTLSVQRAAYRVAEKCTVVLGSPEGELLPLTFAFRPGTGEDAAEETVRLFHQELLDAELRAVIHDETAPLRALILAHTFSRTDLLDR